MKKYRRLREKLVLLTICLPLFSCAAEPTKRSAVAGGQVVDMGFYAVRAPLGGEWNVQTDHTNGMVVFEKKGPEGRFTGISVLPGTLNPGTENQTEDEIITMILGIEEKNMRERGVARSYTLRDVSKEVTTIGGKKLHVMSYAITDRSGRVPLEVKYAMYLYLPPDLKQKRVFYGFVIGDTHKFGESVYETDLTHIHPVIGSLQTK